MSKNNKITKDIVPQDFTIALAISDALPVLFFGVSAIIFGILIKSIPVIIGAAICFISGAIKVLWKIVVVLKQKNIWWMFIQMRIAMPIGFLMMIISAVIIRKNTAFIETIASIKSFPCCLFFIAGLIGMIVMMILAFKLDSSDAKSNKIEQTVNSIAQFFIMAGLIYILITK